MRLIRSTAISSLIMFLVSVIGAAESTPLTLDPRALAVALAGEQSVEVAATCYRAGPAALPALAQAAAVAEPGDRTRLLQMAEIIRAIDGLAKDHHRTLYYDQLTPTGQRLRDMGAVAVPGLIASIDTPDPMVARSLASIMNYIDQRSCCPALRTLARHPHAWVATEAAWALGNYTYRPAVPELIALLDRDDAGIRKETVLALRKIVDHDASAPYSAVGDGEAAPDAGDLARWRTWWQGNAALYRGEVADVAPVTVAEQVAPGLFATVFRRVDGGCNVAFNGVPVDLADATVIAGEPAENAWTLTVGGKTYRVPTQDGSNPSRVPVGSPGVISLTIPVPKTWRGPQGKS